MKLIDELEAENARLEEGYQKSVGVIAATDCAECKRHYEGEIKVRCWENKEKNKLVDELNTELSGYRQNAIVFKPGLMYTLKECEPKLEEWHNENPTYQNLQEIRYRAAKAEYDKIMKVLNDWGIKTEVQKMKLIDADALANYANNQIVGITANHIMRFPTVDAEPVKHGRWSEDDEGFYRCAVCKELSDLEHRYCPNCGAKMDGGTEDNTAKCISDINNIVDTGGFLYYSMYFDGVPEKQLIADIAETYVVSTETATAAFKEILRQWK